MERRKTRNILTRPTHHPALTPSPVSHKSIQTVEQAERPLKRSRADSPVGKITITRFTDSRPRLKGRAEQSQSNQSSRASRETSEASVRSAVEKITSTQHS